MPRVVGTALQNHLNTGTTTLCWCFRIARKDGTILGFTDHDRNLVMDSVTYEAMSGFTGTEVQENIGLNVDNLDIQGALRSDRIKEGDILAGLYDDAAIHIYRVNWRDTSQRVLLRSGSLGELTRSNSFFKAEVRGLAHYLQQPRGRVFQFSCDADLGDARCGVNLSGYTATGTVVTVTEQKVLQVSGAAAAAATDTYSRGKLTWLTGANAGRAIEIKSHTLASGVAYIEIWQTPVSPIVIGDTFSVQAGCDKQPKTCRDRFANFVNFRGFPYMPGNDYVTTYPNRDDPDNDGSSKRDIFGD